MGVYVWLEFALRDSNVNQSGRSEKKIRTKLMPT
jgi:hypothetical protein